MMASVGLIVWSDGNAERQWRRNPGLPYWLGMDGRSGVTEMLEGGNGEKGSSWRHEELTPDQWRTMPVLTVGVEGPTWEHGRLASALLERKGGEGDPREKTAKRSELKLQR